MNKHHRPPESGGRFLFGTIAVPLRDGKPVPYRVVYHRGCGAGGGPYRVIYHRGCGAGGGASTPRNAGERYSPLQQCPGLGAGAATCPPAGRETRPLQGNTQMSSREALRRGILKDFSMRSERQCPRDRNPVPKPGFQYMSLTNSGFFDKMKRLLSRRNSHA